MSKLSSTASAPSNIALIKYMGKNPINSSLSYTLDHLRTTVRITNLEAPSTGETSYQGDSWLPLNENPTLKLSLKSVERFLKHFQFLKKYWGIQGWHQLESANNFPSDCGIASSASSFAALTFATAQLLPSLKVTNKELADLSQKGSGSSCRSFFSPWSMWSETGADAIDLKIQKLHHCVVMADQEKKSISSSKAHELVLTSPHFKGRQARAEQRLEKLIYSLNHQDWFASYNICWDEFMDMHDLFHSSSPSFTYMNAKSHQILEISRNIWIQNSDGPLVTMDAGANVHWLFREDQKEMAQNLVSDLQSQFSFITSFSTTQDRS
ncbi:MAG TPA: diphosphomevalonate decarboxylase [Pseudobdellovibrionaceae bacterium]|nr:diphosphomevalonate decarboxylase [Pseudobdellovibrionaceae bacterium]